MTGPVGDDVLRACYRRAAVTVMPSSAEGFGLPVLESAACGTPALASATTALVEAAATALATFDPADTEAMAEGHLDVLCRRRPAPRHRRRPTGAGGALDVGRRGLPDGTALDELGRTLPAAAWEAPSLRRRLALVGPLPPAGGGIGLYNARCCTPLPARRGHRRRHAPWWRRPTCPPGWATSRPTPSGSRPARPPTTPSSTPSATPTVTCRPSNWRCAYPGWLWLHEVRLPADRRHRAGRRRRRRIHPAS